MGDESGSCGLLGLPCLIGFAFAYLGRVRERWALYSQLTGVDPAVQSHGVGGALKQAQRAWARDQGLELVAWSFDPLQAGNANLNLHRLGAIARTYEVNYFGERTDALNAGLDTDRLLVEWPVQDEPRAWQGDDLEPLALVDGSGLTHDLPPDAAEDLRRSIAAGPPLLPADGRPLQIDVPPLLASLKSEHPALARTWQRAVRDAFVRAFAGRYVAMDFVRHEDENGAARASYVLRRPAP